MKELLKKFENKTPEVVFQWKDSETEAKGWVVINSLRGGAAGGGTRMRVGLDQHEVTSLATPREGKEPQKFKSLCQLWPELLLTNLCLP